MKNSIRVSAKTVDDALTEAIIQLGVTSDQLDYEVIEKGSAGFLGIGMKQAVIEVKRKDGKTSQEEKRERISFDFKPEEKPKDLGSKKTEKEKKAQKTNNMPEPIKADKSKEADKAKKAEKTQEADKSKEVDKAKDADKPQEADKGKKAYKAKEVDKPQEADKGKKAYKAKEADKLQEAKKPQEANKLQEDDIVKESYSKESRDKEETVVEITEETKTEVEKFLLETLKAMSLEVKLSVMVDNDNTLCVDIVGENMGIIIGKRGQTLDSLQYLANRVANKYQNEYIRVKVDTENYRARRDETLSRLAKNLAHKVKRTRRPVSLEPMNPYERRIIHSVLQSNPHVKTHSEGDEPYRKVVITLKRY
jgi:spoIIIJ-associated protein